MKERSKNSVRESYCKRLKKERVCVKDRDSWHERERVKSVTESEKEKGGREYVRDDVKERLKRDSERHSLKLRHSFCERFQSTNIY